jgi:DNA-directed RNA polymerase specialized sigma24 family protein
MDRGRKKKECLSSDGAVPPRHKDYPDYKTTIYDNAKAIEVIKFYIACSDKHKAVFSLYLTGFSKKKIADMLSINRTTVHRILAIFT